MARRRRLSLPGCAHLVLLRAHGGRAVFPAAGDRARFLHALHEAAAAARVTVHAWALGDGEVRLLLTPADASGLPRTLQALGRRYVVARNRRQGDAGTLWDGRYRCAPVEPGLPRLQALLWVDGGEGTGEDGTAPAGDVWDGSAGPAAAAPISAEAAVPPTSASARTGSGGWRDARVVHPPEYWALGNTPFERETTYRGRLAQGLEAAPAAAIRQAAVGGWVHGTAAFAADVARQTGQPARPRPAGRPRKPAHKPPN